MLGEPVLLPDVACEDEPELLMVEPVDDGVDPGVEVTDPQDVQVQAVRRLNFLRREGGSVKIGGDCLAVVDTRLEFTGTSKSNSELNRNKFR
jgi:hypothetical protein